MSKAKNPWSKRLIIGASGIAIILAVAIVGMRIYQAEDLSKADTDVSFKKAKLDFDHSFDAEGMLPFLGSAAFDADGDGRPELFLGGGIGQPDALFKFETDGFIQTDHAFEKSSNAATHGAAHLDYDADGDSDLFLARSDEVVLFENLNGRYVRNSARFPLANNTVPLSIALGDVNGDGRADLYVSGYISLDAVEGETIFTRPYGGYSVLFVGQANGRWQDETRKYGLHRQHNTFTAGFVDLDGDSDQDLVVAQDTGVIETWLNPGSSPWDRLPNPTVSSYPMGLGFGDMDADGDVDIWSSNVGHTLPGALLRGDLPNDAPFNTDYYLLENDGSGGFADVAEKRGVAKLGFGWGSVIEDVDLDGREDLLAAQNYARLPGNGILRSYPGKLLLQQSDGRFADATHIAPDKGFGITPLIADFNLDGAPDLIWANLAGPSYSWISAGGTGNSVSVRIPDLTEFLGAVVTVTDSAGQVQTKHVIAGEGLGSDPTRDMIFGFGAHDFKQATITLRNGRSQSFEAAADRVISWQE